MRATAISTTFMYSIMARNGHADFAHDCQWYVSVGKYANVPIELISRPTPPWMIQIRYLFGHIVLFEQINTCLLHLYSTSKDILQYFELLYYLECDE
jgi:hypothetical protein